MVREAMQQVLEAEMTDALGAEPGERTEARLGYRAGHYPRTLITRVGKLELRVPRDRDGRFSTELFERYQRSEKALVSALAEMYVQGVSTRKVKAITEELCGHSFSASAISQINKGLDESLSQFAHRHLDEPYPYLILDARYERVREGGVIRSQAVLHRHRHQPRRLPADPGGGARQPGEPDQLARLPGGLKERGLTGWSSWSPTTTQGLRKGIIEILPEAAWQRCYVHFLRNALDHLPRKAERRLPAGTPVALRPAQPGRGPEGPLRLACALAGHLSPPLRLGRGEHLGDAHLLSPAPAGTTST